MPYAVAIPAALVRPWIAGALYASVALMWLAPDRQIERALAERQRQQGSGSPSAAQPAVPGGHARIVPTLTFGARVAAERFHARHAAE